MNKVQEGSAHATRCHSAASPAVSRCGGIKRRYGLCTDMEELSVPIGYAGVMLQGVRCVTAQQCVTRSYRVCYGTLICRHKVSGFIRHIGVPPQVIRYTMTPAYRHRVSGVTARKPVSRHKASGVARYTGVS
jgi:hypothetical protein